METSWKRARRKTASWFAEHLVAVLGGGFLLFITPFVTSYLTAEDSEKRWDAIFGQAVTYGIGVALVLERFLI